MADTKENDQAKKDEEKQVNEDSNQSSHFVSEGMMGSTPDNYEGLEEVEPLPPVTNAERDAMNSRGVIQPAIESALAAQLPADAKPKTSEDLQKLADEQKDKRGPAVPNLPTDLKPNLEPDVMPPGVNVEGGEQSGAASTTASKSSSSSTSSKTASKE